MAKSDGKASDSDTVLTALVRDELHLRDEVEVLTSHCTDLYIAQVQSLKDALQLAADTRVQRCTVVDNVAPC